VNTPGGIIADENREHRERRDRGAECTRTRGKLIAVDDPSNPAGASVFNWLFRNRETGEITIGQFPNLALGIFFVTFGVREVLSNDSDVSKLAGWLGLAALGWWAIDEVLRGVNPWRRGLGVAGCAFVVAGAVSMLR
jgi:hypothetical protein